MVEPGAAEDELAQPVDERLALDQDDALPVADEVAAERAARLVDPAVGGELDEVGGLVVVELVRLDRPSFTAAAVTRCSKSRGVEGEAVAEELDDVVVAGRVVRVAVTLPRIALVAVNAPSRCLSDRARRAVCSPSGSSARG